MNNFILENIAGFVTQGEFLSSTNGGLKNNKYAELTLTSSVGDIVMVRSGKEAEELAASLITFANFCREKGIE